MAAVTSDSKRISAESFRPTTKAEWPVCVPGSWWRKLGAGDRVEAGNSGVTAGGQVGNYRCERGEHQPHDENWKNMMLDIVVSFFLCQYIIRFVSLMTSDGCGWMDPDWFADVLSFVTYLFWCYFFIFLALQIVFDAIVCLFFLKRQSYWAKPPSCMVSIIVSALVLPNLLWSEAVPYCSPACPSPPPLLLATWNGCLCQPSTEPSLAFTTPLECV